MKKTKKSKVSSINAKPFTADQVTYLWQQLEELRVKINKLEYIFKRIKIDIAGWLVLE